MDNITIKGIRISMAFSPLTAQKADMLYKKAKETGSKSKISVIALDEVWTLDEHFSTLKASTNNLRNKLKDLYGVTGVRFKYVRRLD